MGSSPSDQERTGEVCVYDLSLLVLGILFDPDPGTEQTGVDDEHVYLPRRLDRLAGHPLDVGAFRHVRREGRTSAPVSSTSSATGPMDPSLRALIATLAPALAKASASAHYPGPLARAGDECDFAF